MIKSMPATCTSRSPPGDHEHRQQNNDHNPRPQGQPTM
eukprot:CAMPEP_0194517906 /NCGR_PEP_ID=MMETSP0253-20130528/51201_1 /TAXON_ID=2966 /ORGANISM="Noctiluca scintillans" /LENGTH=37 /DNA_ID= /DNA_START= /DNA_END= /DNA_ORIENTATION=